MDLLIGLVCGFATGFLAEWIRRDSGRTKLIIENSCLKDDIHLSNDAVERLAGKHNSLLQRCQEKQETINSLMSRVTFLGKEIEQHQVSIDTALKGIEDRQAVIESQKRTAAELVAQIEGRCARVRELGEELDEAKVECIALRTERDSALTLLDGFRDSLSSALAKPNLNAAAWRKVAGKCLS